MPDRRDCIDEILEAIGRRRDRRFVDDHLEDIEARSEFYRGEGMARAESYRKAMQELIEELTVRSAILKRNIRMDAIKGRDLRSQVQAAPTQYAGIEAALVGINPVFFDPNARRGNQLSAAALGLAAKRDWVAGAVLDLERAGRDNPQFEGLDKIFYSRAIEKEWAIEKFELSRGEKGNPGRTGNAQALKIAEILHKWDKARVDSLNAEGGWITNYAGYVTRTSHDPDKLRVASTPGVGFRTFRRGFTEADRDAWVSDQMRLLNLRRTFGAEDPVPILNEMYGGLIDGSHMKDILPETQDLYPNLARKVSASRELHYKDAESWHENNQKYGRFDATDAWLYSMQHSAEQYGLMKVFGSKPRQGYEELVAWARNRKKGTPESLSEWERFALENRFKVVSGESAIPIASQWAGIINGWLTVQRIAKLGLTPFAMLSDNTTISRELARQGMEFMDRNGSMFSGYFRGSIGSDKREVAELLHAGILGRLRGIAARYDISDARAGLLAKWENTFFKITGITPMTENKRADAERMMAYHFGKQREKAWAGLGAEEQRTLQAFGISDKEWELLKKVEWNKVGDEVYLTPDVAQKLSDADIQAYITDRGVYAHQELAITPSGSLIERTKRDLALKLWAYFSERGQFAVLEVGPRERAILYQGTQAGSPVNTAMRLILQFKQFPTAMITKAWGAEIYGGATGMGRIAGLTELIVSSTLFGMMANYLNQLAKSQDPNAQLKNKPASWVAAGFARGGGGTIYGDFLLGEWSRYGRTLTSTLAGPTFGQLDTLAELWADITHATGKTGVYTKPSHAGAIAARFARDNAPFMNMIYTKWAFDAAVYWRLQEALNPGYLQRYEQTMKDKTGVEFLPWPGRPSQVVRWPGG